MLLLIVAALLALLFYVRCVRPLSHFRDRGIPYAPAWPLLGSDVRAATFRRSFIDSIRNASRRFTDKRYFGFHFFGQPILVLRDPAVVKQIGVKAFDHFTEHRDLGPGDDVDPLWARNLFASREPMWRFMRPTLSPAFTSSKMRMMYELMDACARRFAGHFAAQPGDVQEIDGKATFTRVTNDIIATCGFGVEVDSMADPDNEFYRMGRTAVSFRGTRALRFVLPRFLLRALGMRMIDKPLAAFFRKIVADTVAHRERHNVYRPDMIELLMQTRRGTLKHEEGAPPAHADSIAAVEESAIGRKVGLSRPLDMDDLTAQAMIFFFAGFDTTSALMMFIAYELALNPDVQARLRDEVDAVWLECQAEAEKKGGKEATVDYDRITKMKYLDAVVSESLRKWAPVAASDRLCTKDYVIPAAQPGERDVHIRRGDVIFMVSWLLHRNEKYWPRPDAFEPDRFLDENRAKLPMDAYMPFGVGPRNCIGSRFALLENKTVFFHLVRQFEIVVTPKTPVEFEQDPAEFGPYPKGGMWVGLKKRA